MADVTTVEGALIARLQGYAGLTALVGERVYEIVAPAGVRPPFVTLQEISALDVGQSLSGPSATTRSRYQVDAYSDRRDTAKAVGRQVRAALDGYTGDGASGDFVIKSVLFEDRRDLYEAAELAHRVSTDFIVWSVAP